MSESSPSDSSQSLVHSIHPSMANKNKEKPGPSKGHHPEFERPPGTKKYHTELISPWDFLQLWGLEALEAIRIKADLSEDDKVRHIAKSMKIDLDTVQELSEVCGPSNLFCGDEPPNLLSFKEVPKGVNLKSVSHQMRQRKKREDKNFRTNYYRSMKYRYTDEFWFLKTAPFGPQKPPQSPIPMPNVIISVKITMCRLSGMKCARLPYSETFNALGTTTLAEIKDAVRCPMNNFIAGDCSHIPDVDPANLTKSGDVYKSGFFFIEDVFYNDMRQDNKDYSKPIIEWAKSHWPESEFAIKDMDTTRMFDLQFRLGHCYLFTHQADCEHVVKFQDMRLFTAEDCQDATLYPLRTVERVNQRKLCQGCGKLSARWMVNDSALIPTDPCYLCQTCLKVLLYTPDGKKTSNFKAYHYTA